MSSRTSIETRARLGVAGAVRIPLAGLTVLVVATLLVGALAAGPAFASKAVVNYVGLPAGDVSTSGKGTLGGEFDFLKDVAVNQTGAGGVEPGTFYALERVNFRVQRFSATAGFVSAWGFDVKEPADTSSPNFELCTVASLCRRGASGNAAGQLNQGQGIGVDQATGAVYVTDQGSRRVNVFSAKGSFQGAFGWGVRTGAAAFQFCSAGSGCGAPNTSSAAGGQGGKLGTAIGGVTVDANGLVYVADKTNRRVDVFTPTFANGTVTDVGFTRAFGWDVAGAGDPGNQLTAQFEVCTTVCKAPGAGGTAPGQFASGTVSQPPSPAEIAVDSVGNVYVLDGGSNNRVQKFDATPVPTDAAFGSMSLAFAFAGGTIYDIAVDENDHLLVAASRKGAANKVAVAELDTAGGLVDLHGTDFEGSIASGLSTTPASLGGNVYLAAGAQASSVVAGSDPLGQRVLALNHAPTLDTPTNVQGTSATFSGSLVSNGFDATYRFEYSPDGEDWFNFPETDVGPENGPGLVPVTQDATGLTGSQEYRLRLVQSRQFGGGRATSALVTFTTAAAAPVVEPLAADNVTQTTASLRTRINSQNEATTYFYEYVTEEEFDQTGFSDAERSGDKALAAGDRAHVLASDVSGLAPGTAYRFRVVAENATGATTSSDMGFETLPASEVGDSCPNAALRQGLSARLPDCRAYELVSPPDANGQFIGAVAAGSGTFSTPYGAAGSALFATDVGEIPGADSGGAHVLYRSVRGTDGWVTKGLSPSGVQADVSYPGGVTADHRFAQFWVATPGSLGVPDRNVYYTRLPDGTFDLVGRGTLTDDPSAVSHWIAPNMSHLIFATGVAGGYSALQLEPEAPADGIGAVYDRTADGTVHVVSLLPDGSPPGSTAQFQGASADGSSVAFKIDGDLYVRRDNAETILVHTHGPGVGSDQEFAGFSEDGERMFFVHHLDDTSTAGDLYAFNLATETSTLIAGNGTAMPVNVSADGSHVYFLSPDQLDGDLGVPGENNLYLWDWQETRFVATLAAADTQSSFQGGPGGAVRLDLWQKAVGPVQGMFDGPGRAASRTTPDGSVIVFQSHAQLTGEDTGGFAQVYRYVVATGQVDCVSCHPTRASGAEAFLQVTPSTALNPPTGGFNAIPNVTSDGKSVFFHTADALVGADTNEAIDVYRWREGAGVALVSSGRSADPSYLTGMSRDGHDVYFHTFDTLVPEDRNAGSGVIYDARVDGGFSSAGGDDECAGDGCQGPPSAPPPSSAPGSGSVTGPDTPPIARIAPSACRRLAARARTAAKRARVLRRLAAGQQGAQARGLRVRARRQARVAKRLRIKASGCRSALR